MKRTLLFLLGSLALTACSEKPQEKKGAPPALITTTQAKVAPLEIRERTLGTLEAVNDPKIGAELAGRVISVAVRAGEAIRKGQLLAQIDASDAGNQARADSAEIARLQALLTQQERLVSRQGELVQKNFISKNALDDVTAQRDALKSQLTSAQAKSAISRNGLSKTRVTAPFDGIVEEQVVSAGDYVKVGDPLFRLVSNVKLRAHLPFPETAAPRLKVGMPVLIASPLAPESPVQGVVEDIRPTIAEASRAIDVIARLENPGFLKGGGSIDAAVVIGTREKAVMVPEQSVVLRPAGKVVYVISEGKAAQVVVEAGSKQNGMVEIVKGLQGGEILALDGAGFLSNNAAVSVKETAKAQTKPPAPVTEASSAAAGKTAEAAK